MIYNQKQTRNTPALRAYIDEIAPVTRNSLTPEYLQELYRMYTTSADKDCKNYAFFAILNILFFYFTKREMEYISNVKTFDLEDFDSVIALTLLKVLDKYKEKEGGVNFSYYLIKSVKREIYKEYKTSLPLYFPHTTEKNKRKLFENNGTQNVNIINLNDENVVNEVVDMMITDKLANDPAISYETLSDHSFVHKAELEDIVMKLMNLDEFPIFNYKYGIFGEPHTFKQTAIKFNCSTKSVRYKINKFIVKAQRSKALADYRAA